MVALGAKHIPRCFFVETFLKKTGFFLHTQGEVEGIQQDVEGCYKETSTVRTTKNQMLGFCDFPFFKWGEIFRFS